MKSLSKKDSQFMHAAKRAKERLGIADYGKADERDLIRQIRLGAEVAWKTSLSRKVFRVSLRGISCFAAYDNIHKSIASLMPLEYEAQRIFATSLGLPVHGGPREGAGRPKSEAPRCSCGRFTVTSAKKMRHRCAQHVDAANARQE